MRPPRLTPEDLIAAAKAYYAAHGWTVPKNLTPAEKALWDSLSRRPEMVAKKQGMEHLVFATGRVTDATFGLFKQVIFDIDQKLECSHLVIVCERQVSAADERKLKEMGVGVLLIRTDADPLMLVQPRLCCFRSPKNYKQVPSGLRRGVQEAVRVIGEEDVCVGILDLSQILEGALKGSGITANTLGKKINQAQTTGLLTAKAAATAFRVNVPRIRRAHPNSHRVRRRDIVMRAQQIVDDCLAVFFALP